MISPLNDEFQSNITIMFNTSGIGVNVECMEGLMHVRAAAPSSLFVSFLNKNVLIMNLYFKIKTIKIRYLFEIFYVKTRFWQVSLSL